MRKDALAKEPFSHATVSGASKAGLACSPLPVAIFLLHTSKMQRSHEYSMVMMAAQSGNPLTN